MIDAQTTQVILRKGYLWPLWLFASRIWRVIVTGKHGIITAVLAVLSISSPLLRYMWLRGRVSIVWLVLTGLVLLLLVLAAAAISSYWALRTMAPQAFAELMVGGRPTSETLQVLSRTIKRVCERFCDEAEPLLERSTNPSGKFRLYSLEQQFAWMHRDLLNISAMLGLASRELDIPLSRLTDLLFEYDPSMHQAYAQRLTQNLEALPDERIRPPRLHFLRLDTRSVLDKGREIIDVQEAILRYPALHSHILKLAATHSTSQSTKYYARAVSYIAYKCLSGSPLREAWGPRDRDRFNYGISALRFIQRKQQAHSGFDLNESCIAAYKDALRREVKPSPGKESLEALQLLGGSHEQIEQQLAMRRDDDDKTCAGKHRRMLLLSEVSTVVENDIDDCRGELVKRFRKFYRGWRQSETRILLVTHGFSTTVREMFRNAIPTTEELAEEAIKNGTEAGPLPNIFVIKPAIEHSDTDARLMVQTLLEEKNKRFLSITAGDEDALTGFLDNNTKVMLLLGAECFDHQGRVVHPWGLRVHSISKLREAASLLDVVVVAEGYKFQNDLLRVSQFYRHHLDRIEFYPAELIDVIVTTSVRSETAATSGWLGESDLFARKGDRRSKRDPFIHRRPWTRENGKLTRARVFRLVAPTT